MNQATSPSKKSESMASLPDSVAPRSRVGLIVMAVIYAVWLVWLLYAGMVNYQAGNQ